MRETINNLLELAEDLLALVLMDKKRWPQLVVYEIPVAQRDPMCPMRVKARSALPRSAARISRRAPR